MTSLPLRLSKLSSLPLRYPALRSSSLDTCRRTCQNKRMSINDTWVVCGVIIWICHELFHFERSRLQVLCIRSALGWGGVEAGRGADTCVRRGASQMALIYLCQYGAGERAQSSWTLPWAFLCCSAFGRLGLSPHTWAPGGGKGGSGWEMSVVPHFSN